VEHVISEQSKLTEKYKKLVKDPFKLRMVAHCNFKPHPFVVGLRHVAHAADKCGGWLGEATLAAVPCAHPGCGKMHAAHTSDLVAFVEIDRDCTNKEAAAALFALKGDLEAVDAVGFAFIEGLHKIAPPPEGG
jgi:hypothetical protein